MIMPSHFHTLLVSVFYSRRLHSGFCSFYAKTNKHRIFIDGERPCPEYLGCPSAPAEIKLISYNIRWRSGDELREMIELLKHDPEIGKAQIIGLQEVDRNKKRTGNTNTARLIAEELGMYYAWAARRSQRQP